MNIIIPNLKSYLNLTQDIYIYIYIYIYIVFAWVSSHHF
jgi:hypothetical protein